jgi:hypothetical protein
MEQLVRAVAEAPHPIELLPKETIDKGMQALREAVSPELAEHLVNAKGRLRMYQHAKQAALEIIGGPLKQSIRQSQHIIQPDRGGEQ